MVGRPGSEASIYDVAAPFSVWEVTGVKVKVVIGYVGSNEEIILAHRVFLALAPSVVLEGNVQIAHGPHATERGD